MNEGRSVAKPKSAGDNSGSSAIPDTIAAANLATSVALAEYNALRQELLQCYQYMAAATALSLTAIGGVASLVIGANLAALEPPVLLLAAAFVLMMGIGIVATGIHVSTIANWLKHTSKEIRQLVSDSAGSSISVPKDLMGWEQHVSKDLKQSSLIPRLRSLVWLQSATILIGAVAFQIRAAWDVANGRTDLVTLSQTLGVVDVALTVLAVAYGALCLREVVRLRGRPIA